MAGQATRNDLATPADAMGGGPRGVQRRSGKPTRTDTTARSVTTALRVRYADTDRMGVAYYANYLVWFEVARTEWLRQLGLAYRDLEAAGFRLPVIEAWCEYRQPVRYDDEIDVRARGTLLSAVRVEFRYEVVRHADGALAASGRTVHASTDASGRPRRLPDRVRELFA